MSERPGSSISFSSNPMSSQANLQPDKVLPKNVKKKNPIRKVLGAIWATKDTKHDALNKDVIVKTTIKELVLYIFFLVLITIITFGMTNTINYYFTSTLITAFTTPLATTEETGGAPMNLINTAFQADFIAVLQYPLLRYLYTETWYNDQTMIPTNMIMYENKLLGLVRLRQLRVKNNSCSVNSIFNGQISSCYGEYSYSNEDTSPFGNHWHDPTDTAWYYQTASQLQSPIVSGQVSRYGAGGFVKDLPSTYAEAYDVVSNNLINNYWMDRGTRVVFVDFTVYNANINMFCGVRLIAECPAAGGVIPSYTFRPAKLLRYVSSFDYFVLACEILYCVFIIYYTVEEIIEIAKHKLNYFKDVWNVLDVIILVASYICIAFDLWRTIAVNNRLDSLISNTNQYMSFESLLVAQSAFNTTVAIVCFLCWVKLFKHVSFNKTLNQLSETLGRCARDIIGFSVMFFIVFFAYVQLGYFLFGSMIWDYSTVPNSIFALLRTILGDFDFAGLQAASPILGPTFFITYIFFVFFVLINMFLAIINDTYSGVKEEISNSESDPFAEFFKTRYNNLLVKMKIKKEKIQDMQSALENADKEMSVEEWKKKLMGKGFSEAELDAQFTKFDKNGDRILSVVEQKLMMDDLTQQHKNVDQDMDNLEKNDDAADDEDLELTDDQKAAEQAERMANMVTPSEFKVITQRVDTMENSIGVIVNKIDEVLGKLEGLEKAKLERREAMARILDKLNEANNCQDPIRRAQLQQMVREDLERWEVDTTVSLQNATRTPSAMVGGRESSNLGGRQSSALGQRQSSALGQRAPSAINRGYSQSGSFHQQ